MSITTSLVLSSEQHRLLKRLAGTRMMRGSMQNASVSEVIRTLITANEAAFKAEIEELSRAQTEA
ncbi:hypothetical protein ELG97_37180 [Rhizobium leguminosarum]|uniref:hypothetical protein n=1 Tax=Rhizobium leguminosarum TaxID=384 RepID=UPI0010312700|nr:hypothetical protein [Rhizobium leguminosarum]TBE73865.1 hypothetical protein ELG97_37180 [Rhizobium leguminosarum]